MDQLTSSDYKDAITVQSAVNLTGVVRGWMDIMSRMSGMSTEERNHHPINILFSSKIASLTGCDSDPWETFREAYKICEERSQ